MAINLYRHRDQLLASYRQVTDDSQPTEWALFGYAQDSYDLELVSTGTALSELTDELSPSKIQYAFLRVVDPNTELTKYVLINWQGEGAALSRKGLCANHIKDVSGFFRGAHVTITARNEDEVEPAVILEKVSKSSATKLSLKDRSDPAEHIGPVGTNYTRIQPAREINSIERESFWTKQQEEERRRKIEERKRVENDRKKLEDVEKLRELHEAKEREQQLIQKDRDLCRRREEEKNAENKARDLLEQRKLSTSEDRDEDPEEERIRRAEQMRQDRAEEARSLVAGRSPIQNARALFEQNSQSSRPKAPAPVPKSPSVRGSAVSAARQQFMQQTSAPQAPLPIKQPLPQPADKKITPSIPEPAVTSIKSNGSNGSVVKVQEPSVVTPEPKDQKTTKPLIPEPVHAEETFESHFVEEDDQSESDTELALQEEVLRRAVYNDIPITDHVLEDIQEESEDVEDDASVGDKEVTSAKPGNGIRARALYDYQAADETEISFDPDDIITHVDMIDPGWYQGMAPDGSYGLFPANYVEIMIDAP